MSSHTPVVTVDGPSGAGKGTLCMLLAKNSVFSYWTLARFIACWPWRLFIMALILNRKTLWFLLLRILMCSSSRKAT